MILPPLRPLLLLLFRLQARGPCHFSNTLSHGLQASLPLSQLPPITPQASAPPCPDLPWLWAWEDLCHQFSQETMLPPHGTWHHENEVLL